MSPTENPTTEEPSPAGEQPVVEQELPYDKVSYEELCRRVNKSYFEGKTVCDVKRAEEALETGDIQILIDCLWSLLGPSAPSLNETKKRILDEIVSKGYLFPIIRELKFIRIKEYFLNIPALLTHFLENIPQNYFKQVLESGDTELLTTITSELLLIFGPNIDHECSGLYDNKRRAYMHTRLCSDLAPILFDLIFSEHLFAVLGMLKKRNRKRLLDYITYYWKSRDYVLHKKDLMAKFETTPWGNHFLGGLIDRAFHDFDDSTEDAGNEEFLTDIFVKTRSRVNKNISAAWAAEGPFPDHPDDETPEEAAAAEAQVAADAEAAGDNRRLPPCNCYACRHKELTLGELGELLRSSLKKVWRVLNTDLTK
ncbi:MAG: hypothetical protein WC285_01660 [Candidatus Gracilibacteria bacterium]|jgi:hypothetical protein